MKNDANELYTVIFDGFLSKEHYKRNRMTVDVFIRQFIIHGNPLLSPCPSVSTPYVVADGISEQSANAISQHLTQQGCIITIEESSATSISEQEQKIQKWIQKASVQINCPLCGSFSISTGQRGFSLVTGLLGSNKTVNRCGKCGYSWEPKV